MLNTSEINMLGQICNDTWGSGGYANKKSPTLSIKTVMQGNIMTLTYTTVVNVASERNLRDQAKVFEGESIKALKSYLDHVKKTFKASSNRALKCKEKSNNDSIELISTSPYTPRKTAYYRRFVTYEVE